MYRRMDEPGFHRGGFGMDDIAANDTTQQYQNAAQKSYDTFDHPERSASSHRSSLRTAPSTFTPPLPSPLSSAAQQNHSQAQYFMRFIPSRPPSLNRGTYSYSQAQTQSPTFPGPEGHAPYLRTKAPEDASSFDFATQLEMEFRRLELVWQETGKQWKDKHGAPLARSQDMAFRRKIEGGIGIKDDSPIDKEWRDMWKNTNGDWAESEARWRKEVMHKRTASRNEDSYFHTAHADSRNASVADDDKVTNAIIFHFEKEMEKRRRRAERKQYEEMRQDYHNGAGQHLYTSATDPSHPQHVPSRYSYEETEHDISRPKGRQRSPSTMSHPEFHNSRPSLSPSINTHDVPQAGQTDGPLSIVEEVAKQEREQAALARRIQELRAAVEVNEGPKLTRPIPAPVLEQERKRGQDKNKESKLKDGHQRGPSATPNPEAHSPHPSLFPSVSTRDVPQAGQSDNPLSIVEEVAKLEREQAALARRIQELIAAAEVNDGPKLSQTTPPLLAPVEQEREQEKNKEPKAKDGEKPRGKSQVTRKHADEGAIFRAMQKRSRKTEHQGPAPAPDFNRKPEPTMTPESRPTTSAPTLGEPSGGRVHFMSDKQSAEDLPSPTPPRVRTPGPTKIQTPARVRTPSPRSHSPVIAASTSSFTHNVTREAPIMREVVPPVHEAVAPSSPPKVFTMSSQPTLRPAGKSRDAGLNGVNTERPKSGSMPTLGVPHVNTSTSPIDATDNQGIFPMGAEIPEATDFDPNHTPLAQAGPVPETNENPGSPSLAPRMYVNPNHGRARAEVVPVEPPVRINAAVGANVAAAAAETFDRAGGKKRTKEAELRAQEERRAAEDMLAREQRRVEEERRLREEQRVEEARRREVAERREREERARYEQQKRDSQTKEAELRAQEERRAAEDMLAREQRRVEEERRLREEQRVEEARRREAAERREREERARYEQQKRDSEDRKRRWASDITTAAVERPNRARDRKRTKATELRTQEESRASKEPPVRRQHAEARRRKGAERANSEEHKGENEEQKRAPWELYKQRWSTLSATSSNEPIGFQDIPWPILRTPTDPESITLQTISAFILSPWYSADKSRKGRIRDAMLQWDPDKFGRRWMSRVVEDERSQVEAAVREVYMSLVQILNGTNFSDSKVGSVIIPVPQESERVEIIGKQMSTEDIVRHLVKRACEDLTKSLDLSTFSEYPESHGGFSDVYQGRLITGAHVAVKALRICKESIQNPKHLKRAARELHTWSNCKHPNVLQLLGLAVFRSRIGMVSPWVDHGTLTRYLDNNTEVDRCNLCAQISDGLSYLHEIGIVHGDLKGANVLTLADGTPVLNDFGNSMFSGQGLQFTETTRNGTLTVRWAAPELLDESSDCKPSKSADVYALGMTMLEVITGKPPYDGKGDFVVLMLVSTKKHPERPIKCIPSESRDGDKFWQLLEKCWAFIPEQRPSAAAVTTVMKSITPQGLNATNTPQH